MAYGVTPTFKSLKLVLCYTEQVSPVSVLGKLLDHEIFTLLSLLLSKHTWNIGNFNIVLCYDASLFITLKHHPKYGTFTLTRLVKSMDHHILASPWDYGTYLIWYIARQSLRCSHTWNMEVDERSDQTGLDDLKNEFTEDEKYRNLMTWLISLHLSLCNT